jgi:aminoglycoside phosphotransferase (APT) family kinase protein
VLNPSEKPSPVTEETIRAIWSEDQLGRVTDISRLQGGVRNLSFVVSHAFVLRFNTQDPSSANFRNERLAYEILARESLPVPRVLIIDDSHKIAPCDFSVTTRLPGRPLARSWQFLSKEQLRKLIFEIGGSLAQIHACTFPAFGKLHALDHKSWADYVYDHIERSLQQAREMKLLDKDLQSPIEGLRAMHDFAEVTALALIHCDFHYENILHRNGQLSGILDFEWALAGDPAYDFMIPVVRERMVPESEPVLMAGYQSLPPFSPGYDRRVFWYRLFLQLEEAVNYHSAGDYHGAMDSLKRLRQLIDSGNFNFGGVDAI